MKFSERTNIMPLHIYQEALRRQFIWDFRGFSRYSKVYAASFACEFIRWWCAVVQIFVDSNQFYADTIFLSKVYISISANYTIYSIFTNFVAITVDFIFGTIGTLFFMYLQSFCHVTFFFMLILLIAIRYALRGVYLFHNSIDTNMINVKTVFVCSANIL